MNKRIEKIRLCQLVLLAAILTALAFAAKGIKDYLAEAAARKNGSMTTLDLQIQDFEQTAFKKVDGGWRTTDTDPQLVYTVNGLVSSVYMEMDSQLYTGNVVVYYTNPGDSAYSAQKRMFLVQDKDNPSCFRGTMPLQQVENIRIDPTSVAGNVLDFGSIVINPQRTLADYFEITAYTVLMYMIYTALLAAILRFIQEFFTKSYE